MSTLQWLHADGDRLADEQGRTVVLRGVGLGGWMNMENFVTGYPGSEREIRRLLRAAMGEEAYTSFFDTFLTDFFDEADARHLASLGLNSVRIPVNYRHFEDDDRPMEWKETGFARLDRVVTLLARHGLYSVIDLHALPGAQNQHWHSDNPTHRSEFWTHRHFQDRAVALWEQLAERYKDRPEVAGYNPVNEPAEPTGEVLAAFYRRLERAIRAVDPRHVLFLDGNRYSTDFSVFARGEPLPNCVYTAHDYALPGIVGATAYPGVTRGEFFDSSVVEQTFLRRTRYMRETGTPVWIGEFGPVYSADRSQDVWRLALLRDQLEIYAEHGAGWSLWTYKDIGLQGLVTVAPDSAYLRRIRPVLEQKQRLGADSWGGSDAGVRDVLDPVDALFEREFPGFEPYPWGRRQYVAGLVRHIMLAEPLAERFARLFEGITPEEAAEAARSFRFDRTVERTGLSAVLRHHLTRGG
ncbi:cellulase family glycosylhydrolase [Streptomyces sp. NPDC048845]|uniref:glycoside hydrolase family 5 protein n=1 Tax=Streptomyces sp. NPDC048845 TaxID=3155390 RepID=UPI0034142289